MFRYEEFNDWYLTRAVGFETPIEQLEAIFLGTRVMLAQIEYDYARGECPLESKDDFENLFDMMAMSGDMIMSMKGGKRISDQSSKELREAMDAAREVTE